VANVVTSVQPTVYRTHGEEPSAAEDEREENADDASDCAPFDGRADPECAVVHAGSQCGGYELAGRRPT